MVQEILLANLYKSLNQSPRKIHWPHTWQLYDGRLALTGWSCTQGCTCTWQIVQNVLAEHFWMNLAYPEDLDKQWLYTQKKVEAWYDAVHHNKNMQT